MSGALGYAAAILIAAAALRRVPMELARWRMIRSGRSPAGGSARAVAAYGRREPRRTPRDGGVVTTAGGVWSAMPSGMGPSRPMGWLRSRLRRGLHDAAAEVGDSRAVAVWAAAVAVCTAAGFVLAAGRGAAAGALCGLLGPPVLLWSARRRRERLVVEALPEFLERVARSLRAGLSTVAALAEAAPTAGPLSADLGQVTADLTAGQPLEDALERWRRGCGLAEVNLATAALCIGAATGGRRAPAVDGVAATLRDTRAAEAELASLAQQGRLSGILIALLPLCFVALSAMVDAGALTDLYGTPLGLFCLGAGTALNVAAFVWMRRITRLS